MKIKRYTVRDMQEAIRLIKQDFGPEAVIVSSYRVPAKGLAGLFLPRMLEVIAALEEPHEVVRDRRLKASQNPLLVTDGYNEQMSNLTNARYDVPLRSNSHRQSSNGRQRAMQPEQGDVRGRLFEMLVHKEMKAGAGGKGDLASSWRKVLIEMDVDENIADELLAELGSTPLGDSVADGTEIFRQNLRKRVVQLLEPAYQATERARVLTFVGPAGMGKTTALVKLATILSFNEQKKIAMVAVQTYRLGVTAQLQVYGKFLGIPVDVVMTPGELAGALAAHRDKDYILIDTAGRSARNSGHLLELKNFIDAVREPQEVFLTLSLPTKNRDLHMIVKEFQRIKCTKLIFTKLDETDTFGSILNLVVSYGIPAAYLADGQGVPDCISAASPRGIADLLLKDIDEAVAH